MKMVIYKYQCIFPFLYPPPSFRRAIIVVSISPTAIKDEIIALMRIDKSIVQKVEHALRFATAEGMAYGAVMASAITISSLLPLHPDQQFPHRHPLFRAGLFSLAGSALGRCHCP